MSVFGRSSSKTQKGFTLVELLVSLTIGLIITSALVRMYQSNNNLLRYNYALSNIQQDGRYIISSLRASLMEVGRYNDISADLDRNVDVEIEKSFIKDNPIVLQNDFAVDASIGSRDGAAAGPDTLVVNLMAKDSCTGSNFDFVEGQEFHTVNEYSLDGNTLICIGHDGRYLRGEKGNGSSGQRISLLDNVFDFQVLYGVSSPIGGIETGAVTSWVTANRVSAFDRPDGSSAVVAIKLGVLIKNDDDIYIDNQRKLKVLGNNAFDQPNDGLYRVFETVILFRNSWAHLTVGG